MIQVRECTCDGCTRSPRAFWLVETPDQTITALSKPEAVQIADAHTKLGVPS